MNTGLVDQGDKAGRWERSSGEERMSSSLKETVVGSSLEKWLHILLSESLFYKVLCYILVV